MVLVHRQNISPTRRAGRFQDAQAEAFATLNRPDVAVGQGGQGGAPGAGHGASQEALDAKLCEARQLLEESLERENVSATLLAEIEEREKRLVEREATLSHKEKAFAHRVEGFRAKQRALEDKRRSVEEASQKVEEQLRLLQDRQSVLDDEADGISSRERDVLDLADRIDIFRNRPRSDEATQTALQTSEKSTLARADPVPDGGVSLHLIQKKQGPWSAFTSELLKGLAHDAIHDMDKPVPTSPRQGGEYPQQQQREHPTPPTQGPTLSRTSSFISPTRRPPPPPPSHPGHTPPAAAAYAGRRPFSEGTPPRPLSPAHYSPFGRGDVASSGGGTS